MPRSGYQGQVDPVRSARLARVALGLGAMGLAVLGAACADEGIEAVGGGPAEFLDAMGAGDGRVAIQVVARVGDVPVDCTSRYPDLGVPGSRAGMRDLRIFVHDVRLITSDGAEIPVTLDQDGSMQYQGLALLDFEDGTGHCERGTPARHAAITGTVDPELVGGRRFDGVAFRIGVPFELNHIDVTGAPPPLDTTGLFWGWGEGRIFFSAVTTVEDGDDRPHLYQVQIASIGCEGDPRQGEVVSCTRPNRADVVLRGFDPGRDVVVADLGAFLAGADVVGGSGCHSGDDTPSCLAMVGALGLDPVTGAPDAARQTLFHVEPQ